jgi:hypothetical protein
MSGKNVNLEFERHWDAAHRSSPRQPAPYMRPTLSKIRFEMARWSFVLGAALLVYCGVLLLVLWRTAAADGMIPER